MKAPLAFLILLALYTLYALKVVIPTGPIVLDEGVTADIANHLFHGQRLYADVSAPYGPLSYHLYTAIFELYGKSIWALRVTGMVVILAQASLIWGICRQLNLRVLPSLLAPALLLLSTGLFQGCRLTASSIGGLYTLTALYFHISYLRTAKGGYLGAAAVALGLTALTKHNIFAFDLLAHGAVALVGLRWSETRKRRQYLAALFITFSIPFFYLILNRDIVDLIYHDTVSMIGHYAATMAVPIPRPAILFIQGEYGDLARMMYTDLLVAIVGLLLAAHSIVTRHRGREVLLLVTLVASIHLLQDIPLAEISHHMRATIALTIVYALLLERARKIKWLIAPLAIAACYLHVAPTVKFQRYAIDIATNWPESKLPYNEGNRHDGEEDSITKVLGILNSSPSDRLQVIGHGEYLYFFADRLHLTRQSFISPYYIAQSEEADRLRDIQEAAPDIIIVAPQQRPNTGIERLPYFHEFLRREFENVRTIKSYEVYRRKVDDHGDKEPVT